MRADESHAPDGPARLHSGRAHVVLLVLALALVLGFAWWISDAVPRAVEPADASTAPIATSPLEGDPVAPESPARSSAAVPDGEADSGGSADAALADAIPRRPVDVLVVDAASGDPIPGAEVRWANLSEIGLRSDPERPRWAPDPLAQLERARRATTDERGLARVDSRVFPGTVVARLGDLWGVTYADAPTMYGSILVELGPGIDLAIQVVDAGGTPVAGVPVGLRTSWILDERWSWRGTTQGREGIARARLPRVSRESEPSAAHMFACLEIPLAEPIRVAVDLANPPREPLQLVLPPCGSVVVGLRDSGRRPTLVRELMLGLQEDVSVDGRLHRGAPTYEPESIRDGEALYPFVGLGLDLHVTTVGFVGGSDARTAGPRTLGEVVRIDLDLGDPVPVLTGRLVTPEAEPIRNRAVRIRLVTRGPTFSSSEAPSVLTDSAARFRVPLTGRIGSAATIGVEIQPIGIGIGEGWIAQREFSVRELATENDLGDIVIDAPRTIGAGVVVDDLGQPVPEALLVILVSRPEFESGAWRRSSLVQPVTKPDGSFEIQASIAVERVRVRAIRKGHAESEDVEFEPVRRDLRLVVPRACELAGRVLLDDGVDATRIRVRALVVGAPPPVEPLGSDRETRVDAHGAFRLAELPPGRFDVEFRVETRGAPLLRLAGVEVPPNGKAVDARLDAVDLRGLVPAAQGR